MTTSPAPVRDPRPLRSLRLTVLAGLVGGGALVVDTVTITVVNGSFGALDDVLFLVGLAGTLVALVALAVAVGAGSAGARRAAKGVGVLIAALVVLGVLAQVMDTFGHHVFSPSNQGLHGEWSFFTVGVCLLVLAGGANRAHARG